GGTCLIHTTQGELLRLFAPPQAPSDALRPASSLLAPLCPARLTFTREGYVVFQLGADKLAVYTINGKLVAAADLHRQVQGFEVRPAETDSLESSSSRPQSPPTGADYVISAMALSACANFLLVGGNDGLVWILRLYSLQPVHCLPRCKAPVTCLALNYDQRFLNVGLANGGLVVFNVNFNRWMAEVREHQHQASPAAEQPTSEL
uniref:WD_REPEATS_REGION domain-containing protein n=1 Tax=Mesocestoides corti TaxID=53468 RepID=A0A5K3EYF6_MESCO